VFLGVALVLLLVLPSPGNYIGFAIGLVLFAGEVVFWNRTVRRRRAQTGAETLIGQTAIVVTACRPDGQVRLLGEIWEAHCEEGADPGESVVVAGQDELELVVERSPNAATASRTDG
jgi:membrane protein implicated in regulation of membrane protease activity